MKLFALALLAASPVAASDGTLVIAGGAVSPDNAAIYRAFIDAAKGGSIAIIPSASGEPQASIDSFAANLDRHGVERGRIVEVRLAEQDDPATPADEAAWAVNADSRSEIAKIESAGGIWFTGGDQARTMRLLMRDGKDLPMLTAIRKRLAAGAVIGGSSAGAAIMGSGMIVCGDPRQAGTQAVSRDPADCAVEEGGSEPLVLANGLGFLLGTVVDQHFSERGRLPRLARAVACGAGQGLGVDENTAIVIDLARRTATVVGAGSVTAIARSRKPGTCNPSSFADFSISQYRADATIKLRGGLR